MELRARASLLMLVALFGSLLVVTAPAQASGVQQRENIIIGSDDEWDAAHGVRSGSGTAEDPYVISGWRLSFLEIHDTDRHVVIRDNEITRQLILNWNGDRVTVVDNVIEDLRVNQNVKRTGLPTSGRIANNEIGIVGQLRHFDGIFEDNTVGTPAGSREFLIFDNRAVNFDGFNGARFRNNTIYGYMDVRLHGHHHGSGYGDTSHDHAAMEGHGHMGDGVDHTQRYHEVWVTGNTIYSTGNYALGYNDQAHFANDRTANSEESEALNKPHVHYTKVYLNGNRLIGAGLDVSIFNATDELHQTYENGFLEIRDNTIEVARDNMDVFEGRDGIAIRDARYVDIVVADNTITGVYAGENLVSPNWDTGILVDELNHATISILRNYVAKMAVGLSAARFSNTEWRLKALRTDGVGQRMSTDETARPNP